MAQLFGKDPNAILFGMCLEKYVGIYVWLNGSARPVVKRWRDEAMLA